MNPEFLRKLNSATQYPSIDTYHTFGERGRFINELNVDFAGRAVVVSEKLDGINLRMVFTPRNWGSSKLTGTARYFIGSRTELLYAEGDVCANLAFGAVEWSTLEADTLADSNDFARRDDHFTVVFGEFYGAVDGFNIHSRRQYAGGDAVDWRVFDVAEVPMEILMLPRDEIAAWRQHGGQEFWHHTTLTGTFGPTELVPYWAPRSGGVLPTGIADTYAWMQAELPTTDAGLDEGATMAPEGLVVRTPDRTRIAKLRFENYARTLR